MKTFGTVWSFFRYDCSYSCLFISYSLVSLLPSPSYVLRSFSPPIFLVWLHFFSCKALCNIVKKSALKLYIITFVKAFKIFANLVSVVCTFFFFFYTCQWWCINNESKVWTVTVYFLHLGCWLSFHHVGHSKWVNETHTLILLHFFSPEVL